MADLSREQVRILQQYSARMGKLGYAPAPEDLDILISMALRCLAHEERITELEGIAESLRSACQVNLLTAKRRGVERDALQSKLTAMQEALSADRAEEIATLLENDAPDWWEGTPKRLRRYSTACRNNPLHDPPKESSR